MDAGPEKTKCPLEYQNIDYFISVYCMWVGRLSYIILITKIVILFEFFDFTSFFIKALPRMITQQKLFPPFTTKMAYLINHCL